MTASKLTEQQRLSLKKFLLQNEDRDVRRIDLHNQQQISTLNWSDIDPQSITPYVKAYQRLMRLNDDVDVTFALIDRGLDSAHRIAALTERKFLREHGTLFKDEDEARRVYRKAKSVKAQVRHLWANINDMVASHHYRSTLFHNVDLAVAEYFQSIPSYAELFGGTDYCKCEHCASILSPAAYFLDIMRITDDYITDQNTGVLLNGIPQGYTLKERRADLFDLKLNCANTDKPLPYLQIVNQVLQFRIASESPQTVGSGTISFNENETSVQGVGTKFLSEVSIGDQIQCQKQYKTVAEIASDTELTVDSAWSADASNALYTISDDAFKTLAVAGYPFNLPFTLPLDQIRHYLTELKTTMPSVFKTFLVPQANLRGVKPLDVAREYLKLSIEKYDLVTTADASATSLNRYYGYANINRRLPFTGSGTLTFDQDGRTVRGNGTRFRTEIKPGDQISCLSDLRSVTNRGTGTLTFKKNGSDVAGNRTKFLTELGAGDQVLCRGETKTISAIQSDTQLTVTEPWGVESFGTEFQISYADIDTRLLVDSPWSVAATDAPYVIEPLDGLEQVKTFLYRTGLSREHLIELFVQNLSEAELAAGVADRFFINKTGENLPYLRTYTDRTDPDHPYTKIEGLSLKRLDHLNRFIRLHAHLEWSFAELDWFMTSVGMEEITQATIEELAKVKELQDSTKLPVNVLCSFWHDMKTIGKVSDANPQDLFDVVFNNPNLLNGLSPYNSNVPPVPFDPANPLEWDVTDRAGENLTIRTRLLAALLVNDNDLTTLANYLLAYTVETEKSLKLDLTNLTWLYRLTKLPALFGLSVDEYLRLLWLLFYPDQPNHLKPLPGVLPETIDGVLKIQESARWLLASSFSVYDLQYVLTGVPSESVKRSHTDETIKRFILDLSTISAESRIAAAAFVFENIDAKQAELIFRELRDENYITTDGIVLDAKATYSNLAVLFPVSDDSFIKPDVITETESKQAFKGLHEAEIINVEGLAIHGTLAESFTAATPLDFLFTSTGEGQSRGITAYDSATKIATVDLPWTTTPDDTSYYRIQGTAVTGTAQSGSAGSITLATTSSPLDGAYDGMSVTLSGGTGEGQSRTIVSYDGASRVAAVDTDWTTEPDNSTQYEITLDAEGTARGGSPTTITLSSDDSSVPDIYGGMPVSIIAHPQAELQRSEVKEKLLKVKADITHTVEVLAEYSNLQSSDARGGLAQFLDTTTEMLAVLLPFAARLISLSDHIEVLLAPVSEINPDVFALKLTPNSYVTANIDAEGSADVFNTLKDPTHNIIIDLNAGGTSGLVNPTFNEDTDLGFLFDGDAEATVKRDEVRTILLLSLRAQRVSNLIAVLDRALLLVDRINLTSSETDAVITNPEAFGIEDTAGLTFAGVQSLSVFKELLTDFSDQDGVLVKYLLTAKSFDLFDQKIELLAKLTGWEKDQILALINLFWPSPNTAKDDYHTVPGIARLKGCFDLSVSTGVDIYFLLRLCILSETADTGTAQGGSSNSITLAATASESEGNYAGMSVSLSEGAGAGQSRVIVSYDGTLRQAVVDVAWTTPPDNSTVYEVTSLPLAGTNNNIIDANWNVYVRLANSTLSAVNAKYDDAEFDPLYATLVSLLNTLERDALLGYCIWLLNQQFPDISEPSDLYSFLLIDVEMSGCASTSLIAQGIASVQLYMQRCRMSLEPGVNQIEIPDVWWDWMASYSTWEANRKIFLYPENYAEPTLRKNQTPLFKSLTDELLQSNISDSSVVEAYSNYFDGFSVVANLVTCASYNSKTTLPATEQDDEREIDALYLFGRTATAPYTYYFRTFENRHEGKHPTSWTPWQEINLNIVAPTVTPVQAFDRLFIFWSELDVVKSSSVTDSKSEPQSVTTAKLKYSFYSNSSGWIEPQVLVKDLVVNVHAPDYNPISDPPTDTLFRPENLYWKSPYVFNVVAGLVGSGRITFVPELGAVAGKNTLFERQLNVGDHIWCAGETRKVINIDSSSQQLLVDSPWTVGATQAEYKIFPQKSLPVRNPDEFKPFLGSGTIVFVEGLRNVAGKGTDFALELAVGDQIESDGQTRTVITIFESAQQLLVNEPWTSDSGSGIYKIIPQFIALNANQNGFLPFTGAGTVNVTAGLPNVNGVGTRFTIETSLGDQIQCQGDTGTIVKIVDDNSLLMDKPWSVDAQIATYVIIPRVTAAEQLIVVYGAKLDINAEYTLTAPPSTPNPGKDTFIANRNDFNQSLFNSLLLAQKAKDNSLAGDVNLGLSVVLDEDLLLQDTHLVSLNYQASGLENPQPYKAVIDRNNSVFKVVKSTDVLADNYWGNSEPAPDDPGRPITGGLALLYHISGTQSSLYNVGNQPGWAVFDNGDESFLAISEEPDLGKISEFAFVRPLPTSSEPGNLQVTCGAYTKKPEPFEKLKFTFFRLSTDVVATLKQRLVNGGVSRLLSLESQQLSEQSFSRFYESDNDVPPAAVNENDLPSELMDFDGSYGEYFWEIFFYSPFLVAEQLNANRNFEKARSWYQYIFNPTQQADGSEVQPNDRYWRFSQLRNLTLESLTSILTDQEQIDVYNNDPFNPDAIARLRPTAYQKCIVMKYIDNLLEWGDFLFAQDTSESITQATNLYVLAADLLGKRPRVVGDCPVPTPLSFNEIKFEFPNDIPEFLIELENIPAIVRGGGDTHFTDVPFNDINSYFCVPENSEFIGYWDRVEASLFKIRHCMNIQGVERALPLFAPPLDPRALIRAAAAGGTGEALISRIEPAVPNYRFPSMLSAAQNLTSTLMQLGASLLTALEKKDAEELSLLMNSQQQTLLNLTTKIKQLQIENAQKTQDSLVESLDSAKERYAYYTRLFTQGLSSGELLNIQAMQAAMIFNTLAAVTRTASSIAYAVPNVGSPFAMTYGGEQLGAVLGAASGVLEIGSAISTYIAERSLTMANYARRAQEWELQAKLADFDSKQIVAQMAANQLQIQIAERDLEIQNKTIQQTSDLEFFYKNKFTNKELYAWMIGRISTVYFQTYSLCFDLARAAERSYQYELNTAAIFVNFGYWDNLRKGLLAGEGLNLALSQMQKAYLDGNVRTLEIDRTVSLLLHQPKALLDLKTNGECQFELTEKLFDYDFPGHYCRKIKSISISIPAVVGPFQNIKATLIQLSNQIVLQKNVDAVNFLLGGRTAAAPGPDVLRSNWWASQQIAISRGINDSGMFQLDFGDDRYLPFEGTGAVSTWRLSMPLATNQFDFSAISDVIIQLQYTAFDGGAEFRSRVTDLDALKPYAGSKFLSISQQYSQQWFTFMNDHANASTQTLTIELARFTPSHVKEVKLLGFYFILDVAAGVDTTSTAPYIKFKVTNDTSVAFAPGPNNDYSYTFPSKPDATKAEGARSISFDLANTPVSLKIDRKTDGFLDPAVLRNILLVLYYEGQVNW